MQMQSKYLFPEALGIKAFSLDGTLRDSKQTWLRANAVQGPINRDKDSRPREVSFLSSALGKG